MAEYQKETETGKQTCLCYCDPAFGNSGVTEYCALHKAAPKMLATLENIAERPDVQDKNDEQDIRDELQTVIDKARAMAAEVKGET